MSDAPQPLTLEQLPALIARLQDFGERDDTLRKLIERLGATLADLLEHQENAAPELAKAIAEGLRTAVSTIKVDMPAMPAAAAMELRPQVDVVLNPTFKLPSAAERKRGGWKFTGQIDQYGGFEVTATPTA